MIANKVKGVFPFSNNEVLISLLICTWVDIYKVFSLKYLVADYMIIKTKSHL